MTRMISCAFGVLALATCAGNAANPGITTTQIVVSYDDLDLSHAAGAQTLMSRLRTASKQVCGGMPTLADLTMMSRYNVCYNDAMSGAVAQVNSPLVTQLYAQLEPKPAIASQETAEQTAAEEHHPAKKANLFQRIASLFD